MIANGAGSDITMGYRNSGCPGGCLANYAPSVFPADSANPVPVATVSTLVNVSISNGIMTLEFDRAISSTIVNISSQTTIIWAYNPDANAVTSASVFQKHPPNARGSTSVTFSGIGVQSNPNLVPISSSSEGTQSSPDGVWSASWSVVGNLISFVVTVKD